MLKRSRITLHQALIFGICLLLITVASRSALRAGAQEGTEAPDSEASAATSEGMRSPEPLTALPGEEGRVVGVPASELPAEEREAVEKTQAREQQRTGELRVMSAYAAGVEAYAKRIHAVREAGVEVVP